MPASATASLSLAPIEGSLSVQKPRRPSSRDVRFGFIGPALPAALATLENNSLADTIVKDVLGFNAPKITLTRTWKERFDVATLELSNSAITLSSSLLLAPLLRLPVQKIANVPMKALTTNLEELAPEAVAQLATPQVKLARLGASLGFLFPFAAAFWACVFLRNWSTLKRFQSANFESIIGLKSDDPNNNSAHRKIQDELRYQMNKAKQVFGIGAGLGAASLLGFNLAARKFNGKALAPAMEWLFQKFHLTGKGAIQTNWLATLVFWLLPAYAGWLHAARGKNERLEQSLKAANGVMWFSLFNPMIVRPVSRALFAMSQFGQHFRLSAEEMAAASKDRSLFKLIEAQVMKRMGQDGRVYIPSFNQIEHSALDETLKQQVKAWKTKQFGIGLGMTIFFMGAAPQLLNWVLTRRRFERAQAAQRADNAPPLPSRLQRPEEAFQMFAPATAR